MLALSRILDESLVSIKNSFLWSRLGGKRIIRNKIFRNKILKTWIPFEETEEDLRIKMLRNYTCRYWKSDCCQSRTAFLGMDLEKNFGEQWVLWKSYFEEGVIGNEQKHIRLIWSRIRLSGIRCWRKTFYNIGWLIATA